MKRIVLGALLLSALNMAATAAAASASATMDVRFVVRESCTVQLDSARNKAPAVSCGHDSPFLVSAQASAASQAPAQVQPIGQSGASNSPSGWQITF